MKNTIRRLLAALLLSAASGSQAVTALGTFGSCQVGSNATVFAYCSEIDETLIGVPSGTVVSGGDGALIAYAGSANVSGYAAFGRLGASVSATSYNSGSSASTALANNLSTADMIVRFADGLTVNGGALNGQAGFMLVNWQLDGGGGAFVGGPQPVNNQKAGAMWTFELFSATGSFLTQEQEASAGVGWPDSQSLTGSSFTSLIPIVFGQSTYLGAQLEVQASASAGIPTLPLDDPTYFMTRSASGSADFEHTLSWDGIAQVTDAHGNVVTGWSVSSESGTDYGNAITVVPEPAGWALWLAGLAGIAVCRQPRAWPRRGVAGPVSPA
jgi:hypothetical protein